MGLFDSESETTQSVQMPEWLEGAPQEVKTRMMDLLSRPSISPEDRVAGLDPLQQQGIDQLAGYGAEGGVGNDMLNAIMGGVGGYGAGAEGLTGLMGEAAPQNQGIDMDYVNSLINNDVLGGQIDAATRDVERRFSEVDAPQSRLMQALSGGTGSTRGAIGDAILQRGAMDRTGDIAAMMRGGAFGQALGLGGQQAAQNAQLMAGNQGLRLGAGTNLMSGGLQGIGMGQDIGLQNIQALMSGGGMNRAFEQALNDVEFQNWNRAYGDVEMGNQIFGDMTDTYGTRTSENTQSDSMFSNLTSIASMFMGMPDLGSMMGGTEDAFDFSEGGFYTPQFT